MLRISLAAFILGTGLSFAVLNPASAASNDSATSSGSAASNAPVPAKSGKPGWLPVVVARGELKQQIESTPIVDRPNRPFHFYGNAVRRQYYRGKSTPRSGDTIKGGAAPVVQGK